MTLQTSKEPKNRQILMLLSAIVLVFFCISSLSNFFMQYKRTGLRFYFPGVWSTFLLLLNIALRAATVFYFAALYKQAQSKLILTGIFGGYTVFGIFSLLGNLVVFFDDMNLASGLAVFFCLVNILVYGLYTLNVYTDGKLKVIALLLAILTLAISGIGFLGQIINFFEYMDRNLWFYAITNLATGITTLAFALFLVVFAASHGTAAAPVAATTQAPKALTGPERLQLLFQEYQKGNLTEEEFQAKRQEIIDTF